MSDKILEKSIQITNLTQRVVNYNDKKTGAPTSFTVYQIVANDGITYETSDVDWNSKRSIGEQLTIKYVINTNTGATGQVYTNYKLMTKLTADMVMEFVKKIDIRLKKLEPADTVKPAETETPEEINVDTDIPF